MCCYCVFVCVCVCLCVSGVSTKGGHGELTRKERDELERKREIQKAKERREEREKKRRAEERDDALLQTFFLSFEDLCAPGCSASQSRAIVAALFKQLPNCEARTKLDVLEIFSGLLERHPILLDANPFLLEFVIEMILNVDYDSSRSSDEASISTSLQCKLFHIIGPTHT